MKYLILIVGISLYACKPNPSTITSSTDSIDTNKLETFEKLLNRNNNNFFKKMGTVQEGEWLSEHKENGQTYKEYLATNPSIVNAQRNTIYLQPLGEFSLDDSLLLNKTSEYLSAFYGLKVITRPGWKLDVIDSVSQRIFFGNLQLHTTPILYELLKPKLPSNAVVYMAITPVDLYPKEDWHFVFGQASIKDRVGVSSLNRLKAYDDNNQLLFEKSFRRIAKTTSHEIGHMFSIKHCTKYRCNMNGSNHLLESDSKPMWLCPQCIDKVSQATNRPIDDQVKSLLEFHNSVNMSEKNHYLKMLNILQKE